MESVLKLPGVSGSKVRILQITDTHLFAEQNKILLGVNTAHSYHAVVDAIISQQPPFDLIIATGDLSQDHSVAAYQHFAAGVARLTAPCVWLPGNHDFQPAMVNTLSGAGIFPSKQVLMGDHWQILLLDSQVSGEPYGELSEHQLLWMERCLQTYPQRYTLVALHHPPLSSGCTWLDQLSLRNAPILAEILIRYPQVTTLLCGHIHQELDQNWHGKRLLASPSTCVQFKPHCTRFTLDTAAPGWRYLDLLPDGVLETEVHRLASDEFCPDIAAEGY